MLAAQTVNQTFWGLPVETWSAIAAIASAVAAILLFVATCWHIKINSDVRKSTKEYTEATKGLERATNEYAESSQGLLNATKEYVNATKEMVGITHNPIVAFEISIVSSNDPISLILHNIGNAPAIMMFYFSKFTFENKHETIIRIRDIIPFLKVDEKLEKLENRGILPSVSDVFLDIDRNLPALLKPAYFPDESIDIEIEVTAYYQNHIGQYFKSISNITYDSKKLYLGLMETDNFDLSQVKSELRKFEHIKIDKEEYSSEKSKNV